MRKLPLIALSALATAFIASAACAQSSVPQPAAKPAATAEPRKDPSDADNDGRASWDEYRKAMSDNFARLDKNKDNVLESSELPPQPKPNPEQRVTREQFDSGLRASFDQHDADKDGYLAGDELPRRK